MSLINVMFAINLATGVIACPHAIAKHGWFSLTNHDESCSYLLNGQPLTALELQQVRAYGLLQVSCTDCSFNTVSVFSKCDDCLICSHNEGIEKCRSSLVPITLAIFTTVSLILFSMTLLTWLSRKYRLVELAYNTWVQRKDETRVKKEGKRAEEFNKLMKLHNSKHSPALADEHSGHPTAPPLTMNSNIYPELPLGDKTRAPKTPTPSRAKMAGAVSMSLLLALGRNNVDACDAIFFMSSNGIVYEDKLLNKVSTGLIFIHTGSTICFNHPNGSSERITVSDTTLIESYGSLYKTCDFDLEVKSHVSCLGTGECWSASSCKAGVRLQATGPKAYTLPHDQVFCRLVPNLSDLSCYYHQVCTWYYWDIVPRQSRCDIIYSKLQEDLVIHLLHESPEGNSIPFTLSTANPMVSYPIDVHLGFLEREYVFSYDNIRAHANTFLGTTAAGLNTGIPGLLGDLQLPLQKGNDTEEWTYPKHAISCHPDGSSVACTAAASGYSTSLKRDSLNSLNVKVSQEGQILQRIRNVRSYMSLMFKTTSIDSQIINTASCSIEVVSTYACTSCPDLPVIFIKAINIKQTGIMQLTSNCNFFLPEISCTSQSQALQLRERAESCLIGLKGTNETLQVHFEYEFKGQLYSRGILSASADETFGGKMKLAIQSPDFLNSLQISLGIGLMTSVAIAVIKSVTRIMVYKAARSETKNIVEVA